MDELDKDILESYRAVQRKEKILIHIENIRNKLSAEQEKARLLESELDALGMSLSKLQHSSLENIKKILWSDEHQDKVEDVKLDYFVKFMFYKTLCKEIDLYHFELSVLESQLEKLKNADFKLKSLLLKKESILFDSHSQTTPKLLEIQDQILLQRALVREIEEAIPFGEKALQLLDRLANNLKEIIRTGRFEMYGQGRYSSVSKIKYIEQTRKNLELLYHWLQRFNLELKDISVRFKIYYLDEVKQFEILTDDWLNTSFSSSTFVNTLKQAMDKLKHVGHQIAATLDDLMHEIEKAEKSIEKSERKKARLIIQSLKKD